MSKRHRQLGLWEPDKANLLVKLFSNKGEKTIKQQLELHLICNNY